MFCTVSCGEERCSQYTEPNMPARWVCIPGPCPLECPMPKERELSEQREMKQSFVEVAKAMGHTRVKFLREPLPSSTLNLHVEVGSTSLPSAKAFPTSIQPPSEIPLAKEGMTRVSALRSTNKKTGWPEQQTFVSQRTKVIKRSVKACSSASFPVPWHPYTANEWATPLL